MIEVSEIAPDVFIQRHPLSMLGCKMGRNVTILRLTSGKSLIHSTAAFSQEDVSAIGQLGEPGWLFEATNIHDTHASAGRAAFDKIPYIVPSGFASADQNGAEFIGSKYGVLREEGIEVIKIGGMPKLNEHAIYHRSSKTLVVADLLFNLVADSPLWTRIALRAGSGIKKYPAMSRLFRFYIKDQQAFSRSISEIAALDFERIIVGHGELIDEDAQKIFRSSLKEFIKPA